MTIKGKRTYVLKFLNPGTLDAPEMENFIEKSIWVVNVAI